MGTDLYTQPGIEPNFSWNSTSPTAPRLIGLSGRAGSGKDTVGGIIHTLYGHQPVSFAEPLKRALYHLNPYVAFPGSDKIDVQTLVDDLGWDEAKQVNSRDPHGIRGLLQRFGTEVGRKMFGSDFWVEQAFRKTSAPGSYVFTDVRFPNEALAIVEAGGQVFRIERPGQAETLAHPSETALDDWTFDGVIENDGSLLDLQGTVMIALGDL